MMSETNAQLAPRLGQGKTEVVNIASLQRAEVEMAIATARQYPRDLQHFRDVIMSMATTDDLTAQECFYMIPRGRDGTIEGPSVRLAEIAMTAYGNIQVESMITGEDEKFVYATGCCRDLENNVATRESVRRSIVNKHGQRFSTDMILVTGQAAVSIAWRNAVLRVIPRAYITPVFQRCRSIVSGDVATLANRRTEVLKRLQSLGVSSERVLLRLGHNVIDEITVGNVGDLIGMGTAIKENQVNVDEAFPPASSYKTPEPLAKGTPEKPKRRRGRPRKGEEEVAAHKKLAEATAKLLEDETKEVVNAAAAQMPVENPILQPIPEQEEPSDEAQNGEPPPTPQQDDDIVSPNDEPAKLPW